MSQTPLNTNQFALVPIRGMVDWTISRRGTITAQVSPNEAGPILAGQPVILDSAATGPMPQIKAAGNTDIKAFYVVFNSKQDSYATGDVLEITGNLGPVMYLTADATIAMGATVEDVIVDSAVQTLAGSKPRGIALLNGVTGNLVPIMLTTPSVPAS
jgi:hypothetical protein